MDLRHIDTEKSNCSTRDIDRIALSDVLRLINEEDRLVALAVEKVLPQVEQAVERIYTQVSQGGRLIYIGCGTSGRLGVLDAVECPPTFGVSPDMVMGIIAGGDSALTRAVEGAEDDAEQGVRDLQAISFSAQDALVGIAASGRTPYVLGAMDYARKLGAPVIALTCSSGSALSQHADITIAPLPGPEVIAGSTRMKSGTAEKMVLNMISTSLMIKLGKVYRNLMVDVKATNKKLMQRCINIVCQVTGVSGDEADRMIRACDGSCKLAIVCIMCGMDRAQAEQALAQANGHVSRVIEACERPEK